MQTIPRLSKNKLVFPSLVSFNNSPGPPSHIRTQRDPPSPYSDAFLLREKDGAPKKLGMKFSAKPPIFLTYAKSTFCLPIGGTRLHERAQKNQGSLGKRNFLLDGPREDPCVMGQSEVAMLTKGFAVLVLN
jgi:hypothetical protein